MANNLSFSVVLNDGISKALDRINGKIDELNEKGQSKNLQPLNEGLAKLRREVIGLASAFEALSKGEERFFAEQRLLSVLEGRKELQEELLRQAEELQNTSIFPAVDFIRGAAQMKAIGVTSEELGRAMKISADSAAALGVSIGFISKQIAQARVGGFADRFGRLIPGFRELRLEGNLTEQVFDILEQRFAGVAERMAVLEFGQRRVTLNKIRNSMEDLGKVIAEITQPALETIQKIFETFTKFLSSESTAGLRVVAKELIQLGVSFGALRAVVFGLGVILSPLNLALLAVAGVALLVVKNFDAVREKFKGLDRFVTRIAGAFKTLGQELSQGLTKLNEFSDIDTTISPILETLKFLFAASVKAFNNSLKLGFGKALLEVKGIFIKVTAYLEALLDTAGQKIRSFFNKTFRKITTEAKKIAGVIDTLLGTGIASRIKIPSLLEDSEVKSFTENLEIALEKANKVIEENNEAFREQIKETQQEFAEFFNKGVVGNAVGERAFGLQAAVNLKKLREELDEVLALQIQAGAADLKRVEALETLTILESRLNSVREGGVAILEEQALKNLVTSKGFKENTALKNFAKEQAEILLEQRTIGLNKYLDLVRVIETEAFKVEVEFAKQLRAEREKELDQLTSKRQELEKTFSQISPDFAGINSAKIDKILADIEEAGLSIEEAIQIQPDAFLSSTNLIQEQVNGIIPILKKFKDLNLEEAEATERLSTATEKQVKALLDYEKGLANVRGEQREVLNDLFSDARTLATTTQRVISRLKSELAIGIITEKEFLEEERKAVERLNEKILETKDRLGDVAAANPGLVEAIEEIFRKLNSLELNPKGLNSVSEQFKTLQDQLDYLGPQILNTFGNDLTKALTEGATSFRKFAGEFLKQIAKMIVQMLVFRSLSKIFGLPLTGFASFGGGGGGQPIVLSNSTNSGVTTSSLSNGSSSSNITNGSGSVPTGVFNNANGVGSGQNLKGNLSNTLGGMTSQSNQAQFTRAIIFGGDEEVERFLGSGIEGLFSALESQAERLRTIVAS